MGTEHEQDYRGKGSDGRDDVREHYDSLLGPLYGLFSTPVVVRNGR